MAKRVRGAEDFTKRRRNIRYRFQKAVRVVMFNRIWLMESEDASFSLNYRKNIASITRNEQKVGILTLAEKSLLRKEHSFRSIADRKTLVTLVAGFKCFAKIPPKIRARLVPVIKFILLTPGRKIITQGAYPPVHVYYIISGEVEVTKRYFDNATNTYAHKRIFLYRGGDCFGDIEMIEDIPRRFHYKALTDVELLVVTDDDYERILKPVCLQHWEDKKFAVKSLEYFNFFTQDQIISAVKFGQIRQFEPLETIYFEDKGAKSFAYFILSGECIILQCLEMRAKKKGKRKSFELTNLGSDLPQLLTRKKSVAIRMMIHDDHDSHLKSRIQKEIEALESTTESENILMKKRNMDRNLKEIEEKCEEKLRLSLEEKLRLSLERKLQREKSMNNLKNMEKPLKKIRMSENVDDDELQSLQTSETKLQRATKHKSALKINRNSAEKPIDAEEVAIEHEEEEEDEAEEEEKSIEEEEKQEKEELLRKSYSFDFLNEVPKTPSDSESSDSENSEDMGVENRFFDVGSLTFGGIFGLGEKYEHRVIMARTIVQCLMLPRFWLYEKEQNPGNMWQKKRLLLHTAIPSRKELFTNFLKTRKWLKFKDDFVQSNLDRHYLDSNPTKVQDIPIIGRITEPNIE